MNAKKRPWLVFYGTRTALVWATSQRRAYDEFLRTMFPEGRGIWRGRVMPPARHEVSVRELRESDRGWIEDARPSQQWRDALKAIVA